MTRKVTDDDIVAKYVSKKTSAQDRNIEFSLSLKKMRELLETPTCFYTNVVFDKNNPLTLDRADNDKGYTDSNTVACTEKFNQLKRNLTIEEIELLYHGIQKHKRILEQQIKKQKTVWKPLEETGGKYFISNKGEIKTPTNGYLTITKGVVRILNKRFKIQDLFNKYFTSSIITLENKKVITPRVSKQDIVALSGKSVTGILLKDENTKQSWMLHQEMELTYLGFPVNKNGAVNLKALDRIKKGKNITIIGEQTFKKQV